MSYEKEIGGWIGFTPDRRIDKIEHTAQKAIPRARREEESLSHSLTFSAFSNTLDADDALDSYDIPLGISDGSTGKAASWAGSKKATSRNAAP